MTRKLSPRIILPLPIDGTKDINGTYALWYCVFLREFMLNGLLSARCLMWFLVPEDTWRRSSTVASGGAFVKFLARRPIVPRTLPGSRPRRERAILQSASISWDFPCSMGSRIMLSPIPAEIFRQHFAKGKWMSNGYPPILTVPPSSTRTLEQVKSPWQIPNSLWINFKPWRICIQWAQFLSTLQIQVKRIPLCKQLRLPLRRIGIHGTILEVPLTWCPIGHRGRKHDQLRRRLPSNSANLRAKFAVGGLSQSLSELYIGWQMWQGHHPEFQLHRFRSMTTLAQCKNDQPVCMGFPSLWKFRICSHIALILGWKIPWP